MSGAVTTNISSTRAEFKAASRQIVSDYLAGAQTLQRWRAFARDDAELRRR